MQALKASERATAATAASEASERPQRPRRASERATAATAASEATERASSGTTASECSDRGERAERASERASDRGDRGDRERPRVSVLPIFEGLHFDRSSPLLIVLSRIHRNPKTNHHLINYQTRAAVLGSASAWPGERVHVASSLEAVVPAPTEKMMLCI